MLDAKFVCEIVFNPRQMCIKMFDMKASYSYMNGSVGGRM